jgi:DNA replication protein DnaC
VLFWTTGLLVQELLAAKRDLKLSRVLKRLSGYEVLILDDLGYVPQSREEMEVLFVLLAERYERGRAADEQPAVVARPSKDRYFFPPVRPSPVERL